MTLIRTWTRILVLAASLLGLSACGSASIEDYRQEAETAPIDLKQFFNGPLEAFGVVLNRQGKVERRFYVTMVGTWKDDEGVLEEWFEWDDGEKTTRTWYITKNADGSYSGKASDIIGEATGEVGGYALRWKYEMDLEVGGDTYRVTFDDWLYQIREGELINRSYIKKFGLTFGEVILAIRQTDELKNTSL
ncbi:DUF3833 domain-containing protein [Paraferrimonas sedimenticola]|uniref:DUF3833 domain-containing protein n=1 Tax=Paraferrimonas sedimenticola TaxID=375674 RepID=A0AA37RRQ7_9GAMM|nr:DUF3833 domain-containing protein [Paraferrimonas sedimenticola]GLP95056.1 hypothetical protein GCM10007895_03620 [Paraferrimonas sedimenticola]